MINDLASHETSVADTKPIQLNIGHYQITVTKMAGQIWHPVLNHRSIAIIALIICFYLGVLYVMPRSMYMDDYSFRAAGQDLINATWKPLFVSPYGGIRPLAILTIANTLSLFPEYEGIIRSLFSSFHLLNAILFGVIAYRLTRNELSAIISACIFIGFFWSSEAYLWYTQLPTHILGTTIILVAYHVATTRANTKHAAALIGISAVLLVFLSLQFSELALPLIGMLIPHEIFSHLINSKRGKFWLDLLKSLMVTVFSAFIAITQLVLSTETAGTRGGIVQSFPELLERTYRFGDGLLWLTLKPTWGLQLTSSVISLGLESITNSVLGITLILIASACLLYIFVRPPLEPQISSYNSTRFIWLMFYGTILAFGSLVPGIMLKNQILEYRMLYVFGAGFSFVMSGITLFIMSIVPIRVQYLRRIVLIPAFCFVLIGTIASAGQARLMQLRAVEDQHQINAVVAAVDRLPLARDATFIPIDIPINIVSPSTAPSIPADFVLYGVFKVPWASTSGLQMALRSPEIKVLTGNQWLPPIQVRLTDVAGVRTIQTNRGDTPLERALPFSYRMGKVVLHSPLQLQSEDGNITEIIIPRVELYRGSGVNIEPVVVALLDDIGR